MSEIISNPPYNLKFEDGQNDWDINEKLLNTNANFAFVEIGLQLATDKACFLLPKGILSTNIKAELEIKKNTCKRWKYFKLYKSTGKNV